MVIKNMIFRYTLYSLIVNQLGNVDSPLVTPSGTVTTVSGFVQEYFGFKYSFMGWTIFVMIAFIVFFKFTAYLALRNLNFQRR